jgi:hypothetical protein
MLHFYFVCIQDLGIADLRCSTAKVAGSSYKPPNSAGYGWNDSEDENAITKNDSCVGNQRQFKNLTLQTAIAASGARSCQRRGGQQSIASKRF